MADKREEENKKTRPGVQETEPQVNPQRKGSRRDPEERPVTSQRELREKNLDKTLADSFPTSDPPSTIPDPESDDSDAA